MEDDTRIVGERGQVTIPAELMEKFGLDVGDEVVVREADGKIVVEAAVSRAELAEGYRRRHERDEALAAEFEDTSSEADDTLGDAPDWD